MKKEKELEVVTLMIRLYCKKNHHQKEGLCDECNELLEYVKFRRSKCPWGENKPFCANCHIHCYNKVMSEKIRKVMRYSGPRMIFVHPIIAIDHLIETIKQKKKNKKKEKEKEKNKVNKNV